MKRATFGLLIPLALIAATCAYGVRPSSATPVPQPSQTAPPDVAAPSPTPLTLQIGGQIVDFERGFIVFSSGDAFKLDPSVVTQDAKTGKPLDFAIEPGAYVLGLGGVRIEDTVLVTEHGCEELTPTSKEFVNL